MVERGMTAANDINPLWNLISPPHAPARQMTLSREWEGRVAGQLKTRPPPRPALPLFTYQVTLYSLLSLSHPCRISL
jgi:hypothetical protein